MRTRSVAALPAALAAALAPAVAAAQDGATVALPTLTIEAGAAGGAGTADGLVPLTTTAATKTDTPIERIPQSVSVVTQEQLEQRRPQNLEQSIAYVPGVVPAPWGSDNRFSQFLIRGFDVGTYGIFRDGLSQKSVGFSGFAIEPWTLESIEVLRGPNAVLYGETDPGGIVNATTKRPSFEPLRDGFLAYGPFDTVQGAFDLGGPLGAGETLAWRLTGLVKNGETSLANSYNDRALIAPALTWQPDAATSFTLLSNFQHDKTSPAVYLPVAGQDYPASVGPLPDRAWNREPEGNQYTADVASLGYLFSRELAPGVTVRQNLRVARQETDYREFYFAGMADDATMSYADFEVQETARTVAVDNQLQLDFDLGATSHTLLVGLDYNRASVDGTQGYDDSYRIPIRDPDFDAGYPRPAPATYQDGTQVVEQLGLYAHDQVALADSLFASFGLRQTWVKNSFDDRLYGDDQDQDDSKLVGDLGLVWQLPNGLAPYASYATGFVTNIGMTFDGALFKPTQAEQYELGARYRPEGFGALFSAAVFQISKTNVLTTDPDHPDSWTQTGGVRHRGLELEADVTLTQGLSAVAAYTWIDAVITASNDGDEGNVPSLVPEHEATLWANYAFQRESLEGLSLGAGVRYVGESYGDTTNARVTPGHTLFDAALRYRRGAVEGALNVTNLLDKDYYAICYTGGGCAKGDPREAVATLSFSF